MRGRSAGCDKGMPVGGSSSVGRALAFQAGCREFESRLPLHNFNSPVSLMTPNCLTAHVAQLVERFLGKEEVHRFDSDRGLQSIDQDQKIRTGIVQTETSVKKTNG